MGVLVPLSLNTSLWLSVGFPDPIQIQNQFKLIYYHSLVQLDITSLWGPTAIRFITLIRSLMLLVCHSWQQGLDQDWAVYMNDNANIISY